MITKAQYSQNPDDLHEAYYLQFAKIAGMVVPIVLYEKCKEAYKNGDSNLNTIPLQEWDRHVAPYSCGIARANMKINGVQSWSLAEGVCAIKASIIKRIKQERPRKKCSH